MSLNTTDISNGVFISASNGDNTRVKFTNAGTYNIQFSSQFSNTDNSNQDVVIWIRKNGTDVPDSSGTAAIPPSKAGSNGQIIASWNYYLSLAANDFIQLCWHVEQANVITLETIAAGTSPTHPRTPSTILTATRVDTFLSNTGSFSGSFTGILTGTASYATHALSSSYATTASLVNGTVNVTTATIGNTLYATAGTTAGAGTTPIYSVSNASYSSIFVDYSINEGTTNARAGTIQVISVGSEINYTETTTMDIGNTNDITWDIYLSGIDINFDIVNAAGASWRIKFSSRQM
jgi:hypothetical protein